MGVNLKGNQITDRLPSYLRGLAVFIQCIGMMNFRSIFMGGAKMNNVVVGMCVKNIKCTGICKKKSKFPWTIVAIIQTIYFCSNLIIFAILIKSIFFIDVCTIITL